MSDVLLVGLGATAGLRAADDELAAALERAGATVVRADAARPRALRTFALTDLAWARAARVATLRALAAGQPRAVVYSTSTAALLGPVLGAIRFDALAAANRPGRHGLWQRPLEVRRLRAAPLLLPWAEGSLAGAPAGHAPALVVPVPVEPLPGPPPPRDIAALTYGAHPEKKGLDRVLAAWAVAARPGEELVVTGVAEPLVRAAWARAASAVAPPPGSRTVAVPARASGGSAGGEAPAASRSHDVGSAGLPLGVRVTGPLPPAEHRALLRRTRVFLTAPRREDYGIVQLEALAEGCALVTTAAPGPYAALPLARALDPRLVVEPHDLAAALRVALDDPRPDQAEAARAATAPWRRATVDARVADELLPRLLATRPTPASSHRPEVA